MNDLLDGMNTVANYTRAQAEAEKASALHRQAELAERNYLDNVDINILRNRRKRLERELTKGSYLKNALIGGGIGLGAGAIAGAGIPNKITPTGITIGGLSGALIGTAAGLTTEKARRNIIQSNINVLNNTLEDRGFSQDDQDRIIISRARDLRRRGFKWNQIPDLISDDDGINDHIVDLIKKRDLVRVIG